MSRSKNQSGMYFRMARPILMSQGKTQLRGRRSIARTRWRAASSGSIILTGLLVGDIRAHLRAHEPRADGGHRHAAPAQPGTQRLEVRDQGGLRGGVGDHPGKTAIAGHAGHTDDMAASPRDHPRQDGFDRLGHTDQIHVERLPEHRRFELRDQGQRADAGAGDQDIDRAERGRDVGDRPDQGVPVRHVDRGVGDGRALVFQRLSELAERGRVAIDQPERRASPGQGHGGRMADSVGGAGDRTVGLSTHRVVLTT